MKILRALFALTILAPLSAQAGIGFYGNLYFITALNGGSNVYNQVTSGTTPGVNVVADGSFSGAHSLTPDGVNPSFSSLGTYNQFSDTWVVKGFEMKTFENPSDGSSFVFPVDVFYRIYQAGSPSGSFTQLNTTTFSDVSGDPPPGFNRKWELLTGSTNLLAGLSNGNYEIELFTRATRTFFDGGNNMFGFTSAGNPVGSFTVVPEPSRAMLVGFGLLGMIFRRRRR
jgi:hypothetical protein